MRVHEKESAKRANAELLQKIEEGLAHSREVIAQINELLAQRHARVRPVKLLGDKEMSAVPSFSE
jgi:hypothetical protein